MNAESDTSNVEAQRERFDAQAADYSKQHGHPLSQQYRDRFIRSRVLGDVVDNAVVLDAMCGGGEETGYLIEHAAHVEGVDISPEFARAYEQKWSATCTCSSITETGLPSNHFDVVYVCGGLHHIHPQLQEAIDECWRLLKPGGFFVFVEPNGDSWTDALRRVWYRFDKRFGDDEAAISIDRHITPAVAGRFEPEVIHRGGGPAYVLIAQAFIVRTPEWFRSRLARALFGLESVLERTPLNPRMFVCARYRKLDSPATSMNGGD